MKRLILLLLLLIVIAIGAVGYLTYQRVSQLVNEIKQGDEYYEKGHYQMALAAYQRANAVHPTQPAAARIEKAQRMLERQRAEMAAFTPPDTTATSAADSAAGTGETADTPPEAAAREPGPPITVKVPDPLSEQTLPAYIKTNKITNYGTLGVMLNNPDQVTQPIAAQICDYMYHQNKTKLERKIETWDEVKIVLFTNPDHYATSIDDYEKSLAYVQVDREKLKFVWTPTNMFYMVYLDQLENSLYQMYFTRQAILDTVLPYYDSLDEPGRAHFHDYLVTVTQSLNLRLDQVKEQTLLQARPDMNIKP